MTIRTIKPTDVYALNQESGGITIIDVREPDEFMEISTPLAENMPLSTFSAEKLEGKHDKKNQLYLLCRSGGRSMKAAQLLASRGFKSIYNVEGGMIAWEASGLPVIRK